MKISFVQALVAGLVLVLSSVAPSAAQAQARAGGGIAIIDLSYIFKNHNRFQAELDRMRNDVQARENQLRAMKDQLEKDAQGLKRYNAGTIDYKQIETRVAKGQADLQVQVQLQKKEFMEREARMYWTTYQEILNEVRYMAPQNGIVLVLRYNGEPLDDKDFDPRKVMQELNKAVVYHSPQIDITDFITKSLNQRGGAAGAPGVTGRPGVPPR